MFKKYLTVILAVFVINLSLSAAAFAQTKSEKEAKFAEKVKASVTKIGTGKDARVEVKLKGGTNIKGYVSQINENEFVVTDSKTGQLIPVPYANVKLFIGHPFSKGARIAIGIGIAFGILLVLGLVFGRGD